MVLNNLFPVFALIFSGLLLKQARLIDDGFLGTSDRLIYYIFFPLLLFWKIGTRPDSGEIAWNLCIAAMLTVLCIYLIGALCIRLFRVPVFKAGSFSQCCYRFNTYIGMAVILSSLGEPGVRQFAVMIALVIPVINVLAVSTLIWFSGKTLSPRERAVSTVKAIVANPLIIACLMGIVYSRTIGFFPVFINNTLSLAAAVTLPLALISIGASLTFGNIRENMALAILASVIKLVVEPLIGYGMLNQFSVSGNELAIGMLYFALPASPAIFVLSSQLNSDTRYASATIMLSTMLSFFSLTAVIWLFL